MESIIVLIPLLPLTGAVANLFWGLFAERFDSARNFGHQNDPVQNILFIPGVLACGTVGASFILAVAVFIEVSGGERFNIDYFTWFAAGSLKITFGYLVDALTVTMMLVVTGVGFVIHVYSLGYMQEDPDRRRFFVYMNLFIFSMLTLVMANNFVVLFLGWELVGLCSYLLIAFWYKKDSAAFAGTKAFIVNRIGDAGFLIGIFLIFATFGTLHYDEVFANITSHKNLLPIATVITGIGLLLFVGAMGKSAQAPLHVWLPDAMEGPTPVSALIHAATMVTAGVFMVARCWPIFSFDVGPAGYVLGLSAGNVVTYFGCFTALFAATIGLVQTDIKRIIAYSTISQLGYMFIAVGVGAYAAGIFHLVTHAFFKALLFLGAGSVIHILHRAYHQAHISDDPQDIRLMGGLRSKAGITAVTFILAWIAISGIPPFSGFFSKDEILTATYHANYTWVFWFSILGVVLTSLYMSRLVFMVFFGESRAHPAAQSYIHESPGVMTAALITLAALSVLGGFINIPPLFGGSMHLHHFLSSSLGLSDTTHAAPVDWILMIISVLAAVAGIFIAWMAFIKNKIRIDKIVSDYQTPYRWFYNKYYLDEFYSAYIIRPLTWFSESVLWKLIDQKILSGIVNTTAYATEITGRLLRIVQSGFVQTYAFFLLLGIALMLYYLIH